MSTGEQPGGSAVKAAGGVLPILAAAAVGIQVGAATVASRYALPETDPISLGFMRYVIGALSLAPFATTTR